MTIATMQMDTAWSINSSIVPISSAMGPIAPISLVPAAEASIARVISAQSAEALGGERIFIPHAQVNSLRLGAIKPGVIQ